MLKKKNIRVVATINRKFVGKNGQFREENY